MLQNFYKDTITINRRLETGNNVTFPEFATGIAAHIQSITPELKGGQMGRTFNDALMFTSTAIQIGDKIVDQDSNEYEVIGVSKEDFRVGLRHYESTLKKK